MPLNTNGAQVQTQVHTRVQDGGPTPFCKKYSTKSSSQEPPRAAEFVRQVLAPAVSPSHLRLGACFLGIGCDSDRFLVGRGRLSHPKVSPPPPPPEKKHKGLMTHFTNF